MENVKHKRKIPPPHHVERSELIGKKTFTLPAVPGCEGSRELLKCNAPAVAEQQAPDSSQTRFKKGFRRRPGAAIAPDVDRREWQLMKEQQQAQKQEQRREYLAGMENHTGYNVITGGQPLVGKWNDGGWTKANRPHQKSASKIIAEHAKPPPTDQMVEYQTQRREDRKATIVKEGLTKTKKDWGVSDQLASYDGYEVPTEIALNGTKGRTGCSLAPIAPAIP
eukprot:NODE_389_length_1053_cov_934.845618_g246_i0.p1 GENE.NODE_389_length_1053_cov_934.845618_g246_i0~~NODE_389_length_1053_cov_934.845618_g246_i0.p1  ORF type:complete len:223 (-),score=93.06 NODE_389_length_1053_cov_934.845618_g246_i0:314-982(-)